MTCAAAGVDREATKGTVQNRDDRERREGDQPDALPDYGRRRRELAIAALMDSSRYGALLDR
jgi:hypothetical protein